MEGEAVVPVIQNVVATFSMGRRVDLRELTRATGFMHYNPTKFAAAIVRLRSPATTCMVFASGKVVCTGARSEQLACITSHKLVRLFARKGVPMSMNGFSVQNIVSVAYCPFQLDLLKIAKDVSGMCNYEPSMFPGLIYKQYVCTQTIVFICFQSGRCIVTGGKTRSSVFVAWQSFYKEVLRLHQSHVDYGSSGNYHLYQKHAKATVESTAMKHTFHDLSSRVSDMVCAHPLSAELSYEQIRDIRLAAEMTDDPTEEQTRVCAAIDSLSANDLVSNRQASVGRINLPLIQAAPGQTSYAPQKICK
jgi:transcription initiation factor TFIID TATA-box-binding protein